MGKIVWDTAARLVYVRRPVSEKSSRMKLQKLIKEYTGMPGGWQFWREDRHSDELYVAFSVNHVIMTYSDIIAILSHYIPDEMKEIK